MPSGVGFGQQADVLTRFLAKLIDYLLIGIATFIVVTTFLVGAMFGTADTGNMFLGGGLGVAGIVSTAISSIIYVAYFALMESSRGQTVGKMLLKLKVEGPDGRNPSLEAAIKRNAWMLLPIIPFIGGLANLAAAIAIAVTINSSPSNSGWHDEFAGGTRVIKIG